MTSVLAPNQTQQNQWQQNLLNAAGYVQNGGKNAYKKYSPNVTNTSTSQNTSTPNTVNNARPTLTGNTNYNGVNNATNNLSGNTQTKQQNQPVSNNQTINNMSNYNRQQQTQPMQNVRASQDPTANEKMSLPEFVNWGGPGNNTANFNPTMAAISIPSYTKKEESYGTYDTGIGKQKSYADDIGSLGGKTINLFEQIAQGVDLPTGPSSNITNAYSNLDDTLETMAGSADIEAAPDSGYQKRDLKQGYTVDDLNLMAQNGFNSLGDAYQNALNKAAANYNRLGLRGSGFELADEFGNQTDSITSNYLKNVQQLQNDIATKGLEAAREDEYRNADANDKNRFDWANYYTNLAQQNFSNHGQLAGLQQTFGDHQNANELDWNKLITNIKQNNITNLEDAIKLYQGALGQSHGQQIDYGNLNGGLAIKDWEAIKGIWETALKNDQFTAEQKNEILKTILATLATGAQGGKEGFNAMTDYFGNANYGEYIKAMMDAAGYQR